ncbi:MAG TPA: alpha/beta hydrolase [Dictyobacter sp.]|jgi:pimeloyl-ACP methyl ester carboxylesterase|nr:alpha/beta hydrolase [Dictyobacter sp.]
MVSKTSDVTDARQRRTGHSVHYNISYMVQGEEYGTDGAIVLLHDIPAGAFVWDETMKRLAGLNHAIYAFDMLGYGQSDRPWPADTSVWGHADVLSFLFKDLQLKNIILIGHGLGGGVAQVLATRLYREQVRALVLIDTISYLHSFAENWPLTEMEKRRDFDAPQHTEVEDLIHNLRETLPAAVENTQSFSKVLNDFVEPWNSHLGKEVLFQHVRNLVPYYLNSVASDLKVMNKPTLIIWGEKDQQVPLSYGERLHREIPGSQLVTVSNAGHYILFDDPTAIYRAIVSFVHTL